MTPASPAAMTRALGISREIEDAASKIPVQGARYSEAAQKMIDR